MVSFAMPQLKSIVVPVGSLHCHTEYDPKTDRDVVTGIDCAGELVKPSPRFWLSLFSRYGFTKSIFKFFNHQEVMHRIGEKVDNDRLRLTIETDEDGSTLLACSNPTKPVIDIESYIGCMDESRIRSISYANGIVRSMHRPRHNSSTFSIGPDEFKSEFMIDTPIDGYGMPSVYLSLLRLLCMNGAVMMHPAFKSQVNVGKGEDNITFAIIRLLEQFNNEEGYAAIRARIDAAQHSWASIYEINQLHAILEKCASGETDDELSEDVTLPRLTYTKSSATYIPELLKDSASVVSPRYAIMSSFFNMMGDISGRLGLANMSALSTKKQRALPVEASVYDLFNFATECATHYANRPASNLLNGWIGNLVTNEYDMEGTIDSVPDYDDFYVNSKLAVGATGSLN